jgi:hypothetical protein
MASARAIITDTLAQYGLDKAQASNGRSLADWAWDRYLETGDADMVMVELRDQPAFKERFPAYESLAKQGRALSPAEYVAYEQTVASLLQNYGVPDSMFDLPDIVTDMLVNDVSAAEFSERLQVNAQASLTAPPEVRQSLEDLYGVGPGEMLAFFLDPDRALPKIQQQYVSAQIRGAALQRRFTLERAEAEWLASMGYTYEQTREAAERAAVSRGLAQGTTSIEQSQMLLAGLGDTNAANAVQREAASRTARFSGGGEAAAEREGLSGLAPSAS